MYRACVLHMYLLNMQYTYICTHATYIKLHTCIRCVAQLAMYSVLVHQSDITMSDVCMYPPYITI